MANDGADRNGGDDLHWLAESVQREALTLSRETAERVLTEKRMELLAEIAENEIVSIRDLCRRLDRDVSIVSRDLDILSEAGVIDFEENGRAKQPVLAHDNIFVVPIVYDGAVMDE